MRYEDPTIFTLILFVPISSYQSQKYIYRFSFDVGFRLVGVFEKKIKTCILA